MKRWLAALALAWGLTAEGQLLTGGLLGRGGSATYATMTAPASCAAGSVALFLGSPIAMGCDAGITYDAATDTLTVAGSVNGRHVSATDPNRPAVTSVTVNGTPDVYFYAYAAVAIFADGSLSKPSILDVSASTSSGPAALSATDSLTVAITPAAGEASHAVYRYVDNGAGGFLPPVLVYSGTATSFVDDGTATAIAYPSQTGNANKVNGIDALLPEMMNRTANIQLGDSQTNVVVTNRAASGTVVFSLPQAPLPGVSVMAVVTDARSLVLKATGGATIRRTTATGQCMSANAVGNVAWISYLGEGQWITTTYTGTWTPGACP